MQACGWLFGLIPALKIHKNKKDMSELHMNLHMEFFNVHPFSSYICTGIVVAMEEAKENRETIRAIKGSDINGTTWWNREMHCFGLLYYQYQQV